MTPVLPALPVLAQRRQPDVWYWDVAGDMLPDLLRGLWLTVQITVLGLVVAMVLGLVLAILRRSRLRIVSWPVGLFIEFVRSTPLLMQYFFLFFGLPQLGLTLSGLQAGVIGLGIHYATYTSEAYRAGIESVPRGQWEGSTAINLATVATWREVILPQAIPTVIPALGNFLVAAMKDVPMVSAIGLIDVLGAARSDVSENFRALEAYTLAGVLFLALSIPTAMFARLLEKRYGFQRD